MDKLGQCPLLLYGDRYEMSPNNALCHKAYESFTAALKQYKITFAATYATKVKKQVVTARLRNYESVTHMLLQPQDVTVEMYHNVLDIIQTELAPHMRRLALLKQRKLGLDSMRVCDLKAPLDPDSELSSTYEGGCILENLSVSAWEYLAYGYISIRCASCIQAPVLLAF